jgi:thioesterase domain-containing protein
MSADELVEKALEIIGEAISIDPFDFQDHETWKFLGLGDLLASATASDLRSQIGVNVKPEDFSKYTTVGEFKAFLRGEDGGTASSNNGRGDSKIPYLADTEPADPWEGVPKPKVPLSVVLQGQPNESSTIVFLFPDGSGAGTSYGTLPPMGSNICLIGLNSPFLRQAQNFTCSIERMARLWVDEVRKLQPKGKPYILGGWSAGGYYLFEAAKILIADGEKVERLILIDSPCRLEFEALPEGVVAELTRKGLMGASGEKKAPEWLVQHFTSTVLSVDKYMPKPMPAQQVPKYVNFIWVREGLVKSVAESGLDVDMNVKVTRFLLEPRPELKTEGWEKLLPGAEYTFDYMTGNHFQITQPPHVSMQLQALGGEDFANSIRSLMILDVL